MRSLRTLYVVLFIATITRAFAAQDFTITNSPVVGLLETPIRVADLNQDGRDDIVGLMGTAEPIVLLGQLDSTLSQVAQPGTWPIGGISDVHVCDFDQDGVLDLIAVRTTSGGPVTLTPMLGDGNGVFQEQPASAVTLTTPAASLGELIVANIDNDMCECDLAIISDTTIELAPQTSASALSTTVVASAPLLWPGGIAIAADFDVDGDLDFAIAAAGAPEVDIYQTDLATFGVTFQVSTTSLFPFNGAPTGLAALNLDADPQPELVATEGRDAYLFENGPTGPFTGIGAPIDLDLTPGIPTSIATGQFDDDGFGDFAIARAITGTCLAGSAPDVALYLSAGSGAINDKLGELLVTGDFNGDGLDDIAGTCSVLTGGVTVAKRELPFKRGDANNDGTVDLADAIFIYAALFIPGSPAPACLDAADVDDNGLLNISDGIILQQGYLFPPPGVPAVPPPSPGPTTCGPDETPDALSSTGYDPTNC